MALACITFVSAQNTVDFSKADLEWSLADGELTVSITANTKGWVAVGLGSSRMDGAAMFIGFEKNGETYFEEHLGKGHSHKIVSAPRPVEYSVSESDGITSMEFTVAASDFITAGTDNLPIIIAFGARDSFTSFHRYRDSGQIIF